MAPVEPSSEAQIGDAMVRQGKYTEHDAIYLRNKASIGWAFDLYPGYYLKQGEDELNEFFMPASGEDGGRVHKAAIADPWQSVMTKKGSQLVCIVTVFNVAVCANSDFERRKRSVPTQDSFQQTLIYSGRVGNKINVGYREFSNNLARPAFNNNVEYDLTDSRLIGYKGAQIEVLEATNQVIRFKVIRNFMAALQ